MRHPAHSSTKFSTESVEISRRCITCPADVSYWRWSPVKRVRRPKRNVCGSTASPCRDPDLPVRRIPSAHMDWLESYFVRRRLSFRLCSSSHRPSTSIKGRHRHRSAREGPLQPVPTSNRIARRACPRLDPSFLGGFLLIRPTKLDPRPFGLEHRGEVFHVTNIVEQNGLATRANENTRALRVFDVQRVPRACVSTRSLWPRPTNMPLKLTGRRS
jgi:hypothetical protein